MIHCLTGKKNNMITMKDIPSIYRCYSWGVDINGSKKPLRSCPKCRGKNIALLIDEIQPKDEDKKDIEKIKGTHTA